MCCFTAQMAQVKLFLQTREIRSFSPMLYYQIRGRYYSDLFCLNLIDVHCIILIDART